MDGPQLLQDLHQRYPWLFDGLPTTDRLFYWAAIVLLGFGVTQLSMWLSQRFVGDDTNDDIDDEVDDEVSDEI